MSKISVPKLAWALVVANVGLFALTYFSGATTSPGALIGWGANYAPMTLTGESWRLFTSMFLHGSWLHLLINMCMLITIGAATRSVLDPLQFGVVYLLSGLGGGLLSACWNGHYEVVRATSIVFGEIVYESGISPRVSIGASGALMGLAAALAVNALLQENELGREVASAKFAVQFIGLNLVAGLLTSNVDNAAHIGGMLTGALVGCVVYRAVDSEAGEWNWRRPLVVVLIGCVIVFIGAALSGSEQLSAFKKAF